jgi:hypothetical protein
MMNPGLEKAFGAEMAAAISHYQKGQLDRAFQHLEVAHVLGQRHVVPHIASHWWMLKIGLKRKSSSEVVGQAIRIMLGALATAFGIVPVGNTGGTNISMFKRLPVQDQLRQLVE